MLLSMTGFGTASGDLSCGRFVIEIQSVNRKFLDIQINLPKELNFLEIQLRTWIKERVDRGQINARVYLESKSCDFFLPDSEQLIPFKEGWEFLAKKLGFSSNQIDLSFLLLHAPIEQKKLFFCDEDLKKIQEFVEIAMSHLVDMKTKEGAALQIDFEERLKKLETLLGEVERLAPNASIRMRQRFHEKVESLAVNIKGPAFDEQMMRELFFFAEKVDIAEEVTRLKSHFGLMRSMDQGKKIEFLLQEMGREINTIGSKVFDAEIAHVVIEMKGELE
ncbi:MAG: DUF1732 domain-containing protein, partial [Chlamydiia bacterium]|nr:DUF1732 domain-containing protein [Chlamydiia bacterium]